MSWEEEKEKYIQLVCFPVDYRCHLCLASRLLRGNFKPGDGDVYIFNEAARKKYPWMKGGQ